MDYFFMLVIRLVVVFTALPIHEYAHGYVAYKLGDNTAKYSGRLNLNPFTHFDLIGTTMLLLTGFGFAKPVPVNPYNFKNRKAGMALTALAGPVSNVLLALVLMIIMKVAMYFQYLNLDATFLSVLTFTLNVMLTVNIQLAVFNLIPIPPLDGSKVLGYFLSEKTNYMMYQYQNYLMIAVFVLIWTNVLTTPMSIVTGLIYNGLDKITFFVDWIMVAIM